MPCILSKIAFNRGHFIDTYKSKYSASHLDELQLHLCSMSVRFFPTLHPTANRYLITTSYTNLIRYRKAYFNYSLCGS
jgi:hypothetical protein